MKMKNYIRQILKDYETRRIIKDCLIKSKKDSKERNEQVNYGTYFELTNDKSVLHGNIFELERFPIQLHTIFEKNPENNPKISRELAMYTEMSSIKNYVDYLLDRNPNIEVTMENELSVTNEAERQINEESLFFCLSSWKHEEVDKETENKILKETGSTPAYFDYYAFSPEEYWMLNRLKIDLPSAYFIKGFSYKDNWENVNFSVLNQKNDVLNDDSLIAFSELIFLSKLYTETNKDMSHLNEKIHKRLKIIKNAYDIQIGSFNLRTGNILFGEDI